MAIRKENKNYEKNRKIWKSYILLFELWLWWKYKWVIEKLNEALKEIVDNKEIIDSGIEFKLLAKEDIIDKADGSKVYKKGQEIKKYNLTKDGKLTITSLPMGIYELVETKTLDGLVLDTTKYEVKLEQD